MAGVMYFETSDGRYWAKLPARADWFPENRRGGKVIE